MSPTRCCARASLRATSGREWRGGSRSATWPVRRSRARSPAASPGGYSPRRRNGSPRSWASASNGWREERSLMARIETLYVVNHSHTDIGFTDYQGVCFRQHREFVDGALDLVEATADYPEGSRYR